MNSETSSASTTALTTGLTGLDNLLGGLRGGSLYAIAGRSSAGKSTLGLGFARAVARASNVSCAVFSMQMANPETILRTVAAESSIRLENLRAQSMALTPDEQERAERASYLPLMISDTRKASFEALLGECLTMKQDTGLGMVLVDSIDHVGLDRDGGRDEEASNAQRLKYLARELDVPVVVTVHLDRLSRELPERPGLWNLWVSSPVEESSDVVILIDGPSDDTGFPGDEFEVELHVAKNIHGETGTVAATRQLQFARFVD